MHKCILLLRASNTWLNFFMDFSFAGSIENPRHSTPWETTSQCSRRFMSFHFAWSVHVNGYFVHPEHELAIEKKYEGPRRWDTQHTPLHRGVNDTDISRPTERGRIVIRILFSDIRIFLEYPNMISDTLFGYRIRIQYG